MIDSRIEQLRQELKCALAAVDDGRGIAHDLWEDWPGVADAMDTADFRIAKSAVAGALLKLRTANAALARLEDRAAKVTTIGPRSPDDFPMAW